MGDGQEHRYEQTLLQETREDIAKADQKASTVLAGLGIGVGVFLGGLLAGDWSPSRLNGLGEVVWWLGAISLASAIVLAATAVWPRYDASDGSDGIYYWAHVASFSSLTAFGAALDADVPNIQERTRNQLWLLSGIVKKKYGAIRASLALAGVGVGLLLLSLLISAAISN